MKKIILILSFLLIQNSFTAPAAPGDRKFVQSDGSHFTGKLKGDEWFNWVEDKQNRVIQYNKESQNYEYSTLIEVNGNSELIPSGIRVMDENQSQSSRLVLDKTNAKIGIIDKSKLKEIALRKRNEAPKYMQTKPFK